MLRPAPQFIIVKGADSGPKQNHKSNSNPSISSSYPMAAGFGWLGFGVGVTFIDKATWWRGQWLLIAAKAWWRLRRWRWSWSIWPFPSGHDDDDQGSESIAAFQINAGLLNLEHSISYFNHSKMSQRSDCVRVANTSQHIIFKGTEPKSD